MSYSDSLDFNGNAYEIATLSYSRSLFWIKFDVSLNFYNDFDHKNSYGAYAAITYSWDKYTASAIAEARAIILTKREGSFTPLGQEAGSYGYSINALEGRVPTNSASVSYRASAFQASAGVVENGKNAQVMAQVDGAVAIMNGVHFANRIDNSFAVVDTGIPDTRVLVENIPVGETGADGTLLIPTLVARQENSIRIDPASLPVQADMPELKQVVVPASRGGLTVRFKGNVSPASAMVSFKDDKDNWLPAGSEAWVNGSETSFSVGYDGETYLTGLIATNTILIKKPDGTPCNASFEFTPDPRNPGGHPWCESARQRRRPRPLCKPAAKPSWRSDELMPGIRLACLRNGPLGLYAGT